MHSIKIDLQNSPYEIFLESNLRNKIKEILHELRSKSRKAVVITDKNVSQHQKNFINEIFNESPLWAFLPGEKNKSLKTVAEGYDFLIEHGVDRTGVLFILGGGVVGDVGGFIAATYMRGLEYYQIPTSLMAMIDSSIGGKTGINLAAGKNLIGTFYQPRDVLIDLDFLKTLPQREFISGMAEIIKYGLLGDKASFELLEEIPPITGKSEILPSVIKTACNIKARIVQADEKDRNGKRALLNLGHTFAHAIEKVAGYGEYLHGEAVAIGLGMAARLSSLLGYLTEDDVKRVKKVISKCGLPLTLRNSLSISELNIAMHHDKKTNRGQLHFILLKNLGEAFIQTSKSIDEKLLHLLWQEIGAEDDR